MSSLTRLGAISTGDEVRFPMRDCAGEVVGWKRRLANGKPYPDGAKTLSMAGSRLGLFFAGDVLNGDGVAGPLLVLEGEPDFLAALTQGYDAIATPSATGSAQVWNDLSALLRRLGSPEIIAVPHADDAGNRWLELVLEACGEAGCEVRLARLEAGDLDDLLKDSGDNSRAALDALIEGAGVPAARIRVAGGTETHLTETGLAQRFAAQHEGVFLFDHDRASWLVYDGKRWAVDRDGAVRRALKETAVGLYDLAARAVNSGERKRIARFAVRAEADHYQAAALRLAQSDLVFAVTSDVFDVDPLVLNCGNGTLDLASLQLHPHDAGERLSKVTGADYKPDARSELLDRFLDDACHSDTELLDDVHRAAGYSLRGDNREEVFFLLTGPEASGKSTFLEAVRAALGDYGGSTSWDTFLPRHVGGARPELVVLRGKRFLIASELEAGKRLAVGTVKALTGRDTISARDLYARPVEFVPSFTAWLGCNESDLPGMPDQDGALWRRLRIVPFAFSVPVEKRDPALKAALVNNPSEREAVLAWLVEGYAAYAAHGLADSQAVLAATAAVREANNPVAQFFAEACVFGRDLMVSVARLRQAYEDFCTADGSKPLESRKFSKRVSALDGVKDGRTRIAGTQTRIWRGIGLIEAEPA